MTSCKPELENKVSDLHNSIYLLKQKVDLLIHELPKLSPAEEGDFGAFASAHQGAAAAAAAAGTSMPNGRGDDLSHRSAGAGVVTTLVPPPVIGAGRFTNLTPIPFKGFDSAESIQCSSLGSFIPHADFPKFDGSNPKIWVKKCESYFDVYAAHLVIGLS